MAANVGPAIGRSRFLGRQLSFIEYLSSNP